ncbi:MAG TPA: serine/threonine-protein kinase [Planctomycetota bacterium]|nr:serine/threonine-protein kinase [Planctomycetota bacterium]
MSVQPAANAAQTVLALCLELGYVTQAQLQETLALQKQMLRGKVEIKAEQLLLQQRLITPAQYKTLHDELDLRRARASTFQGLTHSQKIAAMKFFGKYDLIHVLSEKGYTRVYKARDTENDRLVVLKVLPPNLTKGSQWIERFRREMHLAGNLSHPNLVTTYECGAASDSPYIAMEWLEGTTIGYRLEREGNIPEHTAWLIVREAAKGLAYAEEFGVVHRDIKPENLLLAQDGRVKIIDMGLAKSLVISAHLTATGEAVGTPLYMAPEQALGKKEIDSRADIYGLGCTIFHMLTGSVPFFAENATDVMFQHIQGPRPDPRDILPDLSVETARLVKRMLAVEPNERSESPAALLEDIEVLLHRIPRTDADRRFLPQIFVSTR